MTIADLLLSAAEILSGLFGKSSELKRTRKKELAELLETVSLNLSEVADKLEQGIEPVKECSELFYYTQNINSLVREAAGILGTKEAKHFSTMLSMATDAPSNAADHLKSQNILVKPVIATRDEMELRANFENELRKLRQASGLYAGAANLVKAGETL